MEKKNQNTNKKIIQTSNKQVNQMRDTRTKNASQKRSKKHRKKQVFGRQSIFAGGFCIVAALAIVIGIFVSNKTKIPYEKQVITLYEKENESLAEQQTNPEAGMDEGISSGLKQVRDYGVKLPESFQNPPIFESTFTSTGDTVLDTANRYAAMYDYDKAIETIQAVSGYESNAEYTKALEEYDLEKSRLFQWNDNYTITHIFFHTLIVDPEKTFDVSLSSKAQVIAYNEAMTTIDEFVKIIQKMYDDGYVLVGLHDVAEMVTQPDGTQIMQMKPIYLPAGKTPFVLSQDDVCYYEYMTGQGFADRFVLDENGKIKNCVWEAKKRGVYMDDCHGRVHWSYPNLQNAFSQGFYPDIISSDLVRVSEYTRPGFSLLYAMSVNSAAGMPVEKILQSVTYTPAKVLGIESKAGEIREGAPADVAILDIRDVKDKTFTDNYGNSVSGNKLFVPLMTVRAGRTAYRQIFF